MELRDIRDAIWTATQSLPPTTAARTYKTAHIAVRFVLRDLDERFRGDREQVVQSLGSRAAVCSCNRDNVAEEKLASVDRDLTFRIARNWIGQCGLEGWSIVRTYARKLNDSFSSVAT